MRGCVTLKRPRILGARLHIHWSALVVAGILFGITVRQPLHAVIAVACYFGIIILHEAGHAFVVKRLGYKPLNIYVTCIHGLCEYEQPDTLREDVIIAWGGVLAQLAVAIPLIVLSQTTPLGEISYTAIVTSILGYISLIVALFNLAPAQGMDGAMAWKLIPILFREARSRAVSKKAAKDILRRFR